MPRASAVTHCSLREVPTVKLAVSAALVLVLLFVPRVCCADPSGSKPRARDLGVPFEGRPGLLNTITDVAGVEVGHRTLISGEGPLVIGRGTVRGGVTAV